jgi:hypothetical protein
MQNDSGPANPDVREVVDQGVTSRPQQFDLLASQREQMAAAERRAAWRAFFAPLAADAGAVVADTELVMLAVDVVAVYADRRSGTGLTFAQLQSGLRQLGVHHSTSVVQARLEHLHRMGFLEPYLPKLHQGHYVVRPAGLAGALAAARIIERGGIDELIMLLDRTRSALQQHDPDPVEVLAHLHSCRNALMVFAFDLQRRIVAGTTAELIEAGRQHDHSTFTHQVAELNQLVTVQFSGRFDLEDAGAALIEAEQFYRSQVRTAIGKVLAQGGAGLNFDVLSPAEYETAALTADVDRLGEVGAGLISDAPPAFVDIDVLVEAVERYQPRSRARIRPTEFVTPADDLDPLAGAEAAHEAAHRHRRLGLEALLAGQREVDLTPLMQTGWTTAIQIIVDAVALDADPQEPFALELSELLLVDAEAPVTYLHPARLLRTDLVESEGSLIARPHDAHQ